MDIYDFLISLFDNINDREDFLRKIFVNYRNNSGLRLSDNGFDLLSKISKYWVISIQEDFKIKQKHFLFLEKNIKSPYYFSEKNKILILFDEKWAMTLKLIDGNLDQMCQSQGLYEEIALENYI